MTAAGQHILRLGQTVWELGDLVTLKADGQSVGGRLTLNEAVAPRGFAVPPHTHEWEHEAFYVLEGEMTFQLDEQTIPVAAGAFFSIPPGTPHGFEVHSEARFLDLRTPVSSDRFGDSARKPRARPVELRR